MDLSGRAWKLPLIFDDDDEMRVQRGRLYLSGSGHRNYERLMVAMFSVPAGLR